VVHTALVRSIRFQDNLTAIGRPSDRERRTALDGLQVRQALLDVNYHIGAASLAVEYLNERVPAAFGDRAKNVLAVVREAVQMNRDPSPPIGQTVGETIARIRCFFVAIGECDVKVILRHARV